MAVAGTDLKEGEPVIVEGGYNLPEGTPVKLAGAKAVSAGGGRPMSLTLEPETEHRRPSAAGSISSPWPGRTSG